MKSDPPEIYQALLEALIQKTNLKIPSTKTLYLKKMNGGETNMEYVMSEQSDKVADFANIRPVFSLPNSLTFKKMVKINASVKSTLSEKPWPPTPDDIISRDYQVNKDLFNLISWIIYPCRQLDDTGLVKLPKPKAEKVLQECQNIEPLLPSTKPSLDQTLWSLTMHRKIGSSDVIDTLHKLGYRISYTERLFICYTLNH